MKRIYLVTHLKGNAAPRLVEALTRQGAVAHVARDTLGAELASQRQLVELVGNGTKVEAVQEASE